ncbi:MAG: enoyl-CoA hydratase-related protein [Pseudomonadota bacterium]
MADFSLQLSASISVSVANSVGTIRLTNPDRHNALSQADWLAIPKAVVKITEAEVRVIILYGEGRSFCAGADISEFDVVRKDPATARVYEAANSQAFRAVREAPIPVLAAMDGYCLGGGFGLAAASDLRLATPRAVFGVPAARLGLAYPVDAMGDIVSAVGTQAAKRLLFTANRITADEAITIGFVGELVAEETLLNAANELAATIASLAPLTHRATKATIAALSNGDLEGARALGDATFDSADYAEGRAAFREKRNPGFNGR